jgi:hypothetical protein
VLEGRRRDDEEEKLREKDRKKLKLQKEANLPQFIAHVAKENDPEPFRKRTKLALPAPQVCLRLPLCACEVQRRSADCGQAT